MVYKGKAYGDLVVLEEPVLAPLITRKGEAKNRSHIKCLCVCGRVVMVKLVSARSGLTKSCGCRKGRVIQARLCTHNMTKSSEYRIWLGIKKRCYNPNSNNYENYGNRGIKMCDRWRYSFENFLSDMGSRPTNQHSIERRENNGDYEPNNCFWATRFIQSRNTRLTLFVDFRGEKKCVVDLCAEFGKNANTVRARLRTGWDIENAIFAPSNAKLKKLVTSKL